MATSSNKSSNALEILSQYHNIDTLIQAIKSKTSNHQTGKRIAFESGITSEGLEERIVFLNKVTKAKLEYINGKSILKDLRVFEGNIENYIGMTAVPTGIIGPLKIIGSAANGDFYIPLATTEGALVASYHRGAKACYYSGGVTSICLIEGVQRSPLFKFLNIGDLGLFLSWILKQLDKFKEITSSKSKYANLTDMKLNIEGNHLIVTFEYHTGDAAGQNMVTICTDAICKYILANTPCQPTNWYIESNYSGDKKATALSFSNVRGKKVTAEVIVPENIVNEVLKTSSVAMCQYWQSSTVGIIQSGAIGAQGQFANGLTALFLATGQDVACVSEASIGLTRMELTSEGDLYCCITLPNLITGTIGGGTSLPTQKECLELMDCYGEGKSRKFAEICGALILAGELSIAAALSAGHFSSAHEKLGRKKI